MTIELCEWDPVWDSPALSTIGGDMGCPNEATVSVGYGQSWHLCASCAALPRFKRFRKRTPIGSARVDAQRKDDSR